jgi:hypothetical protein
MELMTLGLILGSLLTNIPRSQGMGDSVVFRQRVCYREGFQISWEGCNMVKEKGCGSVPGTGQYGIHAYTLC